jgi:UDP-N-acetyl-D-glucosamine dehydrogenase
MAIALQRKIAKRTAKVAILGLGYVGLPLAVNFAKKGYQVVGVDKDMDRVKKIQKGENYILDISSHDLKGVVKRKKLLATTDFSILRFCDVIIICVPTPIKRRYTPDISYIVSAVKAIGQFLRRGTLVVLESTTYPGTTRELILPELEKTGLRVGRDFYLSFSPERIDPGNKTYDVTKIPKVVGGLTTESGRLTKALYSQIIKTVYMVSSAEAAEMTKLLENSFRIINIGWINEVAMMCHKLGVNIWEIIEAAKTKPFGYMPFYPGLGVGGHCIPEDPLYLYWKAKQYGFSSKYIKLSADTNSHMPQYVVSRLNALLREHRKTLSKSKILVLGVTYKKDVKDLRKSPALTLIEILQRNKAQVDYYDPLIPYLKIGGIRLTSIKLQPSRIRKYAAVLVATDHTKVDYGLILRSAQLIFDIRNVYRSIKHKKVVQL